MGEERRTAEKFAGRLAEAYGAELRSVVLYGSAARGDYRPGVSDLNLLVIVGTADAAALRRGSTLAREWAAAGNPPPLLLGEAEWRDSADVFPIEYSDIRDAHIVLHGADPLEGMRIRWEDLRLQCEHELKSKQIRLREHFLLAAEGSDEVGRLLMQALPTFLTLFRTALRLAGDAVPPTPEGVIDAVAARAGFDPSGFQAVQRARAGKAAFAPAPDAPEVTAYLNAVERATRWLDALDPAAPHPDDV